MDSLKKLKAYGWKRIIHVFLKYKWPTIQRTFFSVLFRGLNTKNIILLESMNDFDMNAGTFYEYLIRHNIHKKYKIVWFVKGCMVLGLPDNVEMVPFHGFHIKREYYNNVAKYIFYDNIAIRKLRKQQTVVYLGHATRAMKNCRGLISQPPNIDYLISASEFNNELMASVYECDRSKMITTGMPVTDLLFRQHNELSKIQNLQIEHKKVIIWMPTFRKSVQDKYRNDSRHESETGLSLITTANQYTLLQDILSKKKMQLIIKFHPSQDMEEIKVKDTDNIMLLSADRIKEYKIDTYKLLTQMTALISDYSSISFDYLLLDQPIAYVLSDYEEYKLGFAVENHMEYMPGTYIYNLKDMIDFIHDVQNGIDQHKNKRNALKEKIHTYYDGRSCERIANYFKL